MGLRLWRARTTPARLPALVLLLLLLPLLAACGSDDPEDNVDPAQVDAVTPPKFGACRQLTLRDVAQPSNATRTVRCSSDHTAETYAVVQLPERFADAAYDDPALALYGTKKCAGELERFLGATESVVMRSVVSWAWFRPSEKAWAQGARWFRCDVVGGGEQSQKYVNLPVTARGLLLGKPKDTWMVCADGPTVAGAVKVPCSKDHTWRAVATVMLDRPDAPYPGDREVEAKTHDFCSDQVHAWLNYPVTDYDFAYTWFRKAEWEAGNRRSVCWAKTSK